MAKRILYASARPPYPFFLGGAARCAHMLLHHLSLGHSIECIAVGSETYSVTPWSYPDPDNYATLGIESNNDGILDCGYSIQILPNFTQALSDFIDAFQPDIIWTQLEGALEVLELAKSKGIQGLYYVHDAEFDANELQAIANLNCHIVCSSGFLAKKTQYVIGRPAHTVYPAAELYFGTKNDTNGLITMINPHRVKGLPTFLNIAKQLPEQQFLLVESWKLNEQALIELQQQLDQLPNIQFMHRVSDMRTIYQKTKLLLIPSIWEEGFGMVSIEAQSCYIPIIASKRGGLPESVGNGGILIEDFQNVDKWLLAINTVLESSDSYQTHATKAFEHADLALFTPKSLASQFYEVCSAPAPHLSFVQQTTHHLKKVLKNTPLLNKLFN